MKLLRKNQKDKIHYNMTKQIFNIFSKPRKTKERAKINKEKIIIDYREKNSLIASELIKEGFDIEFRELKIADYIINNIAIERKTIPDFISSMINKRIIRQLQELQHYENRLLIIEGTSEQELYGDDIDKNNFSNNIINFEANENKRRAIHPNAIRGFLLSITIKQKIPIILTKNYEDTARYLSLLAKKKERESSLNVTKKSLNKKERLQFILEGFPGIGPKTSKKLLEKFGSIKKIVNASIEELTKIIGKKADVFKLFNEEY